MSLALSANYDEKILEMERLIGHACSLAMGYGAGRDDLKQEYQAAKDQAIQYFLDHVHDPEKEEEY